MLWALLLAAQETLTGTVTFTGKVPEARRIEPPNGEPFENRTMIVDEKSRALAEVLVQLTTADGKPVPFAAVPDRVTLKYGARDFEPRVLVVPVGSRLAVSNTTGSVHTVRAPSFNVAVNGETVVDWNPRKPERFDVKCDCCGWERATIVVTDNAATAVTGPDGAFKIEGLKAGTYRLTLWHRELKEITIPVDVPAAKGIALALDGKGIDADYLIERALARAVLGRTGEEIAQLTDRVRQLGDENVEKRDEAERRLIESGASDLVKPALGSTDPEVMVRARRILTAIGMKP